MKKKIYFIQPSYQTSDGEWLKGDNLYMCFNPNMMSFLLEMNIVFRRENMDMKRKHKLGQSILILNKIYDNSVTTEIVSIFIFE